MPKDLSRIRQLLRATGERQARRLRALVAEHPGLIRGTFGTRRRVCGRPNCRCVTRGELHESHYLSATVEGGTRQVHVPAGDEVMVASGVRRYRRWRQRQAELLELGAEQMSLLDQLFELLLEPYPPDDPIPPPRKRGGRAKKVGGRKR